MLRGVLGSGGGTPVGGTGNPNTIPRWTGPSTLGDSGLIDNGTAIYTTTRNFGIGTASPAARLDVLGSTSAGYFRFKGGNTSAGYGEFQNSSGTSLGLIGNGGGGALSGGTVSDLVLRAEANLLLAIGNTERARIDSAGRFFIGASTTPNVATVRSVVANAGSVYTLFQNTTANVGGAVGNPGSAGLQFWATSGALGAETYTLSFSSNATGLDVSTAGYGLKLPATPGNADTQTLDCYQENPLAATAGNGWTPTLSAAGTWGGTQPNVTYARYVRMGSMVFCEVKLTMGAGTMTSTYGTTTIDSPFVTNTNASHAAVPVAAPGASGVGFQTGTTVYLPTIGASSTFILTWSFFA